MRAPISFTVYGKPEPQGSMKAFAWIDKATGKARAAVTSDNTVLKPWRQEMSRAALEATGGPHEPENLPFPKHVPVSLSVHFYLDRPPSIPKKRLWPAVKPDLSKLVRAVEDSLTGIVWADDAQVVHYGNIAKAYGNAARCEIVVQEWPTVEILFGHSFDMAAIIATQEKLNLGKE